MPENKHTGAAVSCEHCHNAWDSCYEVTNSDSPPQRGDIFLCPKCGTVNSLTLLGWKEMSDLDWVVMKQDEMKDLKDAMVRIQYDNLMRDHNQVILDGQIIPGRWIEPKK